MKLVTGTMNQPGGRKRSPLMASRRQSMAWAVAATAVAVTLSLAGLCYQQVGTWRDTETLARRALQVTQRNHIAHYLLGVVMAQRGEKRPAMEQFERALRYNSNVFVARLDLALFQVEFKEFDAADKNLRTIMQQWPLLAAPHLAERGDAAAPFLAALPLAHHDLRARRVVAELNAATEVPDREPMPEEALMAAESHSSVVQLLDHLSPGQRRVVELRLAGLTGREVAEVLGCSLPAVKIAQVRAYSRLRDLVTDPAWEAGHHGDR